MDQLHQGLSSLKLLRTNVGQIFETLGGGIRIEHGEEHGENKFLQELQELLTSTNTHLRLVHTTIEFHFICNRIYLLLSSLKGLGIDNKQLIHSTSSVKPGEHFILSSRTITGSSSVILTTGQ